MFVTENPNRYLINMSHHEMAAMRKLFNAAFLMLEGEGEEGLWANMSIGEKNAIGRWMRRDPLQPTGPRRQRLAKKKALSPVA